MNVKGAKLISIILAASMLVCESGTGVYAFVPDDTAGGEIILDTEDIEDEPVISLEEESSDADDESSEVTITDEEILSEDEQLPEEPAEIPVNEAEEDILPDEAGTEPVPASGDEPVPEAGGYRELDDEGDAALLPEDTELDLPVNSYSVPGFSSPSMSSAYPALQAVNGADENSSAFPYPYTESDELLNYLKDTYPDTRTQGGEGACWAFAVTGGSEFYMINHDLAGRNIDNSELHLAYWCYADEGTPSIAGDTGDTASFTASDIVDFGGNFKHAAQSLMQRRGIAAESVAPYSNASKVKYPHNDLMFGTERNNTAYLKNAYKINKGNPSLVKQAVVANGGVGISLYSSSTYRNSSTGAVYVYNENTGTNHAVMVVGWDDDYPVENFRESGRPSNKGAWLCRNSYTVNTSVNNYNSYFWLSYEDKSVPAFWVMEYMDSVDPRFDNAYFYDSHIHGTAVVTTAKSANIYRTASGNTHETLNSISVDTSTEYADVGYTIEVYTDISDPAEGPESGTRCDEATTTGTFKLGGTYTVKLENPVLLDRDEYFAIVVSLDTGKSVNLERNFDSWAADGFTAGVAAGESQSFYMRSGAWVDVSKIEDVKSNFIIHALTENGISEEIMNKPLTVEEAWGDITDDDDRLQCGTDSEGDPQIPQGLWIAGSSYESDVTYSGDPVTFPGLRVYNGNVLLTQGTDYTVSYSDNRKASGAGKASFTVRGKGNYSGSMKKNFTISPVDIGNDSLTFSPASVGAVYTGKTIRPSAAFFLDGKQLISGTDHTIEYYASEGYNGVDDPGVKLSSVKDAGDYFILLRGKGNYSGVREVSLKVQALKPISSAVIHGFLGNIRISSDPGITEVTQPGMTLTYKETPLTEGVKGSDTGDYYVEYRYNDRPGTATMIITGMNDYAGSVVKTYKISSIQIKNAQLEGFRGSVMPDEDMLKNRRAIQKDIKLMFEGQELAPGTDYTVDYLSNDRAGRARMTIRGIGRYSGSYFKLFRIDAVDISSDAVPLYVDNMEDADAKVRLYTSPSIGEAVYTPAGGKINEALTYSDGVTLKRDKDYKVKYANNFKLNADPSDTKYVPASVTYSGRGLYKGSVKCTFDLVTNDLGSAVEIRVDDKVRSGRSGGLFSIPKLTDKATGKVLKAGSDYDKDFDYRYLTAVTLKDGTRKNINDPVEKADILKEGQSARIRITVKGRTNLARQGFALNNSYTGEISAEYRVVAGIIDKASVSVNGGKAYTCTGREIRPGKADIVIKVGKTVLDPGDYVIEGWENNQACGTARIYLKGSGRYAGSKVVTFRIVQARMK